MLAEGLSDRVSVGGGLTVAGNTPTGINLCPKQKTLTQFARARH
ncbi:hypothetical protein [Pseudomonas sp. FEN]|nr:hypothetical protein [Pseudomonas sp. FEN]